MTIVVRDEGMGNDQLLIVSKYLEFFRWMYPKIRATDNKHSVLRNEFICILVKQIELFNDAAKTDQASKLYLCDSGLSSIRSLTRLFHNLLKRLTNKQITFALEMLNEIGRILGSWIKKKKSEKKR